MESFIALGIFFALTIMEFIISIIIFLIVVTPNECSYSKAEALVVALIAVLFIINATVSTFITTFYHDPTSYGYQKIEIEQTVEIELSNSAASSNLHTSK